MRRKFLSVVLCVCMMLTMAPFAFAAKESDTSTTNTQEQAPVANSSSGGSGGSTTSVSLPSGNSGNLTISTDNAVLDGTDLTYTNGTITVTAANVTIQNLTFGDKAALVVNTPGKFTLTGCTFTPTTTYTKGSNNQTLTSVRTAVTLNVGEAVVTNNTFNGVASGYYNAIEFGIGTSNNDLSEATITGNTFNSAIQNNYFNFYNMTEGATIDIESNHFLLANKGSNAIRISNFRNVSGVTFNVNNNEYTYANDSDESQYEGFILLEDYSPEGDTVQDFSGITININNLTSPSNAKQLFYVYDDQDRIIARNQPIVKGDSSISKFCSARIGDTYYASLANAVAAATDGRTVTLLKNATENVNISAGKSVAINLNGYTVTVPSDCGIELQGKLTVTGNGKITCANTPICVDGNSAELTVNDGTIESTNGYGIYAENGGSVVVNGGTIFSQYAALSGNNTTGSMNFTVNSGTLTAAQGPAIYMPGQVSLNISGGTLNGGVSLRMGQVNISGGTINAITKNIDSPSQYYNYSGNAWLPDALYVFGGTYPNGDETHGNSLNLNITGGTFNCTNGQGSAVAIYDLGKVKQDATIKISGTAKLATNASSRSAYQVLRLADIGVTSSTGGYGVNSGKVTSSITGGLFSTTIDNTYCATGLTAISNTDEATKADYPYTVGTIKANDENKIDAVTTTGTNTVNTDTIQEASKADATTVANQVKLEDSIADKVAITETDKQRGLTALVNENKVNVDATGKLTDSTTITIIKEIFLDVSVTEFNLQNNDPSIIMDITPMYSLIATTNKDNCTDSNSVKLETKPISVTDATKISITLPTTTFANKKVYITHKNDIYIATADADGKIEFTTNGFSPFTFSLTNQDIVAEVNGNAYKTLQEAANAAKDGEEINIVKNDKLDLNFTDTKSVKVTNKTSDKITVKFNGVNKDVAKDATETFSYTRPSSGGPGSSGGSISTPTTYAVNVNAATNGAVAADKKTASKGTTVTVTASPSKGYVVDAVKVVDKDGKDVAVTGKDGKYVFTMPGSAVAVTGSFKAETPAPVALPFTDVKSGNWFYDAVKYAYAQGLMTGTSATTFAPNGTMNRAMIVTVLYRLEKSPAVTGASKFTDVPAGQWYSDAVAWAAANKIVNGYDETTFGPMNAVTREQMAAILFRYEQVKGLENVTLEENLNRFPDQNKISAYAIPALQWAVGQKIINGNADGTLDPTGTATRAQVAQIFTNLLNK